MHTYSYGMVCVLMQRYPKACSSAICKYVHIYIYTCIQLHAMVPKALTERCSWTFLYIHEIYLYMYMNERL